MMTREELRAMALDSIKLAFLASDAVEAAKKSAEYALVQYMEASLPDEVSIGTVCTILYADLSVHFIIEEITPRVYSWRGIREATVYVRGRYITRKGKLSKMYWELDISDIELLEKCEDDAIVCVFKDANKSR